MFFIISKLLAFLIAPIVWVTILLIWALLTKDPRKKSKRLLITFVVFYFFSNTVILDEFFRPYETPAVKESDLPGTYDAGIVLGGMIAYDHELVRLQFDRSVDRLMQAITLYKDGKIRKIFLSGGSGSLLETDVLEAVLLKQYLLKIGIPDSSIIVEGRSKNTRENALFSKPLLDSLHKNGKYLLITSAFHMPRALRCFRKVGINATPFSVDRYAGPRKFVFDHMFIPATGALDGWNVLLHEWLGLISYKIAGYI
jgi:uncharacterized SAM-binding protein YcdF (DUF218 family)